LYFRPLAPNNDGKFLSGLHDGRNVVGQGDFAEPRVFVVAVLVDGLAIDTEKDVTEFESGGFGGRAGQNLGDVSAAGTIGQFGVLAQLRVARVGESQAGPRESGIRFVSGSVEEMLDNR